MEKSVEFEYVGIYSLDENTNIRSSSKDGHIQIKFIEKLEELEYSVNLYKIDGSKNEYHGKFVSHFLDTKEQSTSGDVDCKMLKDGNETYLIGNWIEESERYGWTFLLTKENSL